MRFIICALLLLSCSPKYLLVSDPNKAKLKDAKVTKVETIIYNDSVMYRVYYK